MALVYNKHDCREMPRVNESMIAKRCGCTVNKYEYLTLITTVVNTAVLAHGIPPPVRAALMVEEPLNVTTGMFDHSAGCTAAAEMYQGVLTRFPESENRAHGKHGQVMINDGGGGMEMENTVVDIYAVGDVVAEVVGVMDFGYGRYEVEPQSAAEGMAVNVSGVVTGVMYSGFFLQSSKKYWEQTEMDLGERHSKELLAVGEEDFGISARTDLYH
eukprot:gene7031-8387_t